jgi:hypothetical protein
MPYAKMCVEEVRNIYSKVLPKLGQKKFHNPDIPQKELMIRAEVLRRDFTKRQLNIVSMILSFSYYVGKEKAIIPKMQDWEIAGISKIKARHELTQLVEMNVIEWNEEENTFAFKDIRDWEVKYHSGYNHDRTLELFDLNAKDSLGEDFF